MWLIRNQEKIIKRNRNNIMIKKNIKHENRFLFENEKEPLDNILKKMSKNIKINILASPYCYVNNKNRHHIKFRKSIHKYLQS